jgi:TonB-dependent receptor
MRIKLSILALFVCTSVLAQNKISGYVFAEQQSLPFATVFIENTSYGTTTNEDGFFELVNIPDGEYILKFSFVGYQSINKTVSVSNKSELDLGVVELGSGSITLDEVVIKGSMKNSEAKAINMTRISPQIVNIIATDGVGKLPDKNAAEAVQRVPAIIIEKDHGEGRYVSVRGTPRDWSASLINGNRMPVADENGDSRTLAFDVFPAELIEYIVVAKALTPDVEADAIGGSINFITRTAPSEQKLDINLSAGYNAQAQKPIYSGSVLYGNRLFNDKLGYLISASVWHRNYGTDNYQVFYGNSPEYHALTRYELRDYTGIRRTIGLNASAEYKFNDDNYIYFKAIYGGMKDDEYNRKMQYWWARGSGMAVAVQNIHNIMNSRLFGGELGTDFTLGNKTKVHFNVGTYDNKFGYGNVPYNRNNKNHLNTFFPDESIDDRNGYFVVQFDKDPVVYQDFTFLDSEGNAVPYIVDTVSGWQFPQGMFSDKFKFLGIDHPDGEGDAGDYIYPLLSETLEPDDFYLAKVYSELNNTWEKDPLVMQLDINYRPNVLLNFKFGAKVRAKEGYRKLSRYDWVQDFSVYSSALDYSRYNLQTLNSNGGFLSELDGMHESFFVPFLSDDVLNNFIPSMGDTLRGKPMDIYHDEYSFYTGSFYHYNENAYAGYAMATYQLSEKMQVYGGLRTEQTYLSISSMNMDSDSIVVLIDTTENGIVTTQLPYIFEMDTNFVYTAFLPSFHVKYQLNDNSNLRLAITRSYRRPNFNEIKPGTPIYNETAQEFVSGNIDLKPTYSWNFDVMGEYFFGNVGMVSAGLFYKHITNHIFQTSQLLQQWSGNYSFKDFQNSTDKSYVTGFEISLNRRLDFLPGFLSGLGINANYTRTFSEMVVPGREVKQPLPRQADHVANLALYYENKYITTRLALNYKSDYLLQLDLTGEPDENGEFQLMHKDMDFDIFVGQQLSLDYSLQVRVSDRLHISANANNLLNTPLRIYKGEIGRPVKTEFYSFRGSLGIKYSI